MARQYRKYTDQDIVRSASESTNISQYLSNLGLRPCGGNYIHAKKTLQRLNIDTSHWKGQAWNKDKQLKDYSMYKRATNLKKHLIKSKGSKCEHCCNSTWMDHSIPLEIHHIDGDRTNNQGDNLQLLCPNCHALTDTWRGRTK